MKRLFFSMGLAVFLLAAVGYANAANHHLSDRLIRLHIIAAGDSVRDQQNKLAVRDAVLRQISELLPRHADKQETKATALRHSDLILAAAKEALEKRGCDDAVSFSYGTSFFDEKINRRFDFPSGEYETVRITIGEGGGENWWCVMYPYVPSDSSETESVKTVLPQEEYTLITSDRPAVKFRLKTVDYLMKIKEKIKAHHS